MKRKSLNKTGKSACSLMEKKCDALLTPIIKKKCPNCEACGQPTQVAHHWIEKSRSSNLRYNIENLIALCNSCHSRIHNRFGNSVMGSVDVTDTIRKIRGEEWFERMKREGSKIIKKDIIWYTNAFERLTNLLI